MLFPDLNLLHLTNVVTAVMVCKSLVGCGFVLFVLDDRRFFDNDTLNVGRCLGGGTFLGTKQE